MRGYMLKRLRWSRGSVLSFGTQVRGFKPDRSRRIFKGKLKSLARRGTWMFVCCDCCVLSGRGLCDELITRSEESLPTVVPFVFCSKCLLVLEVILWQPS